MWNFGSMSRLELKARLKQVEQDLVAEERRKMQLQREMDTLNDNADKAAREQDRPIFRLAAWAGAHRSKVEAQFQHPFRIRYREQGLAEARVRLAQLEQCREALRSELAKRTRAHDRSR